jgi:hypothetical protein
MAIYQIASLILMIASVSYIIGAILLGYTEGFLHTTLYFFALTIFMISIMVCNFLYVFDRPGNPLYGISHLMLTWVKSLSL